MTAIYLKPFDSGIVCVSGYWSREMLMPGTLCVVFPPINPLLSSIPKKRLEGCLITVVMGHEDTTCFGDLSILILLQATGDPIPASSDLRIFRLREPL